MTFYPYMRDNSSMTRKKTGKMPSTRKKMKNTIPGGNDFDKLKKKDLKMK